MTMQFQVGITRKRTSSKVFATLKNRLNFKFSHTHSLQTFINKEFRKALYLILVSTKTDL